MSYNDFHDIFAESCFPTNQKSLVECTDGGIVLQQADLCDTGMGETLLIRIDPNHKDPFPYFKQGEPYHLKRICDYFILVSFKQKWHLLLVEMKSGGGTALQQLENSECFWHFVLNSAKRNHIDISNFGSIIKVKLHQSGKSGTKLEKPRYDTDAKCIIYHWKNFSMKYVFDIASENHLI